MSDVSAREGSVLRHAFEVSHDGYSSDRVILDTRLNAAFISQCRVLGMTGSAAVLNRKLMNFRKRRGLNGIRTTKRTSFPDDDSYRFASEMSIRFLERRDQVTIDDILCHPDLALEFDGVCERIAPGFSSLEYRWAALKLRKSRNLPPEQLSHLRPSSEVHVAKVTDVDVNMLPRQAGLYLFFTVSGALYAGETANLQARIRKHLDHSDNKGLARWMWEHGEERIHLELHYLSGNPETRVRRALEGELIRSRRPLFNTQSR